MPDAARANGDLFDESRADQIFRRFREYHADNPAIWRLFQRFALELVASGRTKYAAGAIIERIRWHVDIETRGDSVKINNDFIPYYARMFVATHPQHAQFFRLRYQRSADAPAHEHDESVAHIGAARDDPALMEMLCRMATNPNQSPPLKETPNERHDAATDA